MKFSIPNMTCGHCKAVVERTIIDLDSNASVVVNLGSHTAEVETTVPAEAIIGALKTEGYTAERIG